MTTLERDVAVHVAKAACMVPGLAGLTAADAYDLGVAVAALFTQVGWLEDDGSDDGLVSLAWRGADGGGCVPVYRLAVADA